MKKLLLLCLVIAAVLAAGVGIVYWQGARSLPTDKTLEYSSFVSAPVEIYFDQRGRPFVYAESFADAFFAQGYLHARDRLWQMEMFRRAGSGRLAEVLGADGLATDIAMWRAGVPELAKRMQAVASTELKNFIRAYVDGVNSYIYEALPPEFLLLDFSPPPWRVEDVFTMGALMAQQSANNLDQELLRLALIQELGCTRASIFSPEQFAINCVETELALATANHHVELVSGRQNPLFSAPAMGRNAWAVSTDDGPALFACDSHDGISLPNLTYDVHLFVRDQQIRGNSVPGLLGVINGFNEFMAWGFTNIGDSQDVFLETMTEGYRFLDGDDWYQAELEEVEIPVRGAEPYKLTLVTTRHGRLISEAPAISVRWAPLEQSEHGLDALLKLNRATSFAEFNQALDVFVAPSATATYADVTGRVAQRTLGLLPVRGAGVGLVPLPAGPSNAWRGMIPMTDLPREESAEYVAAANTPLPNTDHLVSADNATGYRTDRIGQMLRDVVTPEDMHVLQTDQRNLQAESLLPRMVSLLDEGVGDHHSATIEELMIWANNAYDHADKWQPLFFARWYQRLIEGLFRAELSVDTYNRLLGESYVINQAIDGQLLAGSAGTWPVKDGVNKAFELTVYELKKGETWGQHHQLMLKHEFGAAFPGADLLFNRGPYEVGGGNATVGRARYSHKRPFQVSGGATTRIVLQMAQPIKAWMISPGGQSGHPLSDYYNDQTDAWVAGEIDLIVEPKEQEPELVLLPMN